MPEVVIKYPEGRYTGQVNANNEPEGQGMLEFPGNDEMARQSYEGGFASKKANGFGVMRWREGDKYEGDWKDGLRHGKGYYFSKSTGAKYEGEYQNDLKHGFGKYTYPNGDIYEGSWENGKRHGKGVYKYKEDQGAGRRLSKPAPLGGAGGARYEGDWVEGIKKGKGIYTFASGDVFEGEYDNNERHGPGTLVKTDGEKRSEQWKEGKLVSFTVLEEKKK